MNHALTHWTRQLLLTALACVLLLATQKDLAAQGSFELSVSEDEDLALHPHDAAMMHMAMWKTEADAQVGRTVPTFVLDNNGTVDITQLKITLRGSKATQYAFDLIMIVDEHDPVDGMSSLTMPTDPDVGGSMTEYVQVDFTMPLEPGGRFVFKAYLAPLPSAPVFVSDYRRVLWDIDLATTTLADTSDNALVEVTYADGESSQTPFFEYLPVTFTDYQDGEVTGTSTFAQGGHHMVTATAVTLSVPVPEPSTCTLGIVAAALALCGCRRSSRRRSRCCRGDSTCTTKPDKPTSSPTC